MPKASNVNANDPEATVRAIGTPTDASDHLLLGQAHFYLGQYESAAKHLSTGLGLQREHSILSTASVEQLVTVLCVLRKVDQAAESITRYQHLVDPSSLPRLREFQRTRKWPSSLGADFMEFAVMFWLDSPLRRPDLAEVLCTTCSILSPSDPKAWFNLGRALADQRKFDRAISAFTERIRLTPGSVDALVSRAWCYKLSGRIQELRRDVERIRAIDPEDSDIANLLS
jgi:tetratricopeptide (TPR) repeat protein